MPVIDKTFRLIKSMNRNEKRYLKLFASITEGEKNYLLIFDEMDKQEVYDEKKIREKFRGKKFISNLAAEKKYLFQFILKALKNYHSGDDRSFVSTFGDIEMLIRKGLAAEAIDLAEKEKKRALQIEFYSEYLMLSRFMLRAMGALQNMELHDWLVNHAIPKDFEVMNQLKFSLFIVQKQNTVSHLAGKYKFPNHSAYQQKLDEVNDDPMFDGLIDKVSTRSKIALWNYYIMFYTHRYDFEKAYQYCNDSISYIRTHQMTVEETGYFNYPVLLYYLIHSATETGRLKTANEIIKVYLDVINLKYYTKKPEIRNQFVRLYCEFYPALLIFSKRYQDCLEFYTSSKSVFKALGETGGTELMIANHYYRALAKFWTGQYNDCLDDINLIAGIKEKQHFSSLYFPSQILYLMAHTELGNHTFILNHLRNFSRYFSRHEVDPVTINKIKNIFKGYVLFIQTPKQIKSKIVLWIEELNKLAASPFQNYIIRKSSLQEWLQIKIIQTPDAGDL